MKLTPIGSHQTEIITDDGRTILYSYETPVAVLMPNREAIVTREWYSKTTSRHIKAWLQTHGVQSPRSVTQETIQNVGML